MKTTGRLIYGLVCIVVFSMIFFGCKVADTKAVVSDAFTSNWDGSGVDPGEILPNVTAFYLPAKEYRGLVGYLTASRISDVTVRFKIEDPRDNSWIQIGPDLRTNSDGIAKLNSLRNYIPADILDLAPIELRLMAQVKCDDGWSEDKEGVLNILSNDTSANPDVVFTDHDNTIHATGGANTISDYIDFVNMFGYDWPYVDCYVKDIIPDILDRADMVIITGQPESVRPLTRDQMVNHFSPDGTRTVPIIVKADMDYAESADYKAAAITILRNLYGAEHCLAMVGDTASEDGYGALASGVEYIPFQIKHLVFPDSLDIGGGFDPVDPDDIAWDWRNVYSRLF
ncbi:MAG: hypothetical protein ACOZBW_07210 [Thermodesulfobacteriota bacterium]